MNSMSGPGVQISGSTVAEKSSIVDKSMLASYAAVRAIWLLLFQCLNVNWHPMPLPDEEVYFYANQTGRDGQADSAGPAARWPLAEHGARASRRLIAFAMPAKGAVA